MTMTKQWRERGQRYPNGRAQQRGMGMLGILMVLLLASFMLTCAFKLIPIYIDAWAVKDILQSIAEDPTESKKSSREIRRTISKRFNMNQVDVISIKDVEFERKKGKRTMSANYEKRVPLIQNIDVVVKFENFVFELPPRE